MFVCVYVVCYTIYIVVSAIILLLCTLFFFLPPCPCPLVPIRLTLQNHYVCERARARACVYVISAGLAGHIRYELSAETFNPDAQASPPFCIESAMGFDLLGHYYIVYIIYVYINICI